METKKPKLHLRKQIIISIPISLVLTLFIFGLVATFSHNKHVEIKNIIRVSSGTTANDSGYKLDLSFLDPYKEALNERQIDNTIGFYAKRFKIDEDKVIAKARELTDNYKSERYLQTYTVNPNSNENNPNQEAGIIRYVKSIYSYPEHYGFTWEEIHLTDERDTERRYNAQGRILMRNNMTFEQYVAKISNILEVEPSLALAIIYNESGRLRSNLFTINNNVAGMKSLDGWAKYPTLEAGTISFLLNLKGILNKYQYDINTDEGVLALSSVYVNGYEWNPSYVWYENVTNIRREIQASDLFKNE